MSTLTIAAKYHSKTKREEMNKTAAPIGKVFRGITKGKIRKPIQQTDYVVTGEKAWGGMADKLKSVPKTPVDHKFAYELGQKVAEEGTDWGAIGGGVGGAGLGLPIGALLGAAGAGLGGGVLVTKSPAARKMLSELLAPPFTKLQKLVSRSMNKAGVPSSPMVVQPSHFDEYGIGLGTGMLGGGLGALGGGVGGGMLGANLGAREPSGLESLQGKLGL